jgi:hypothetical protein
VHASPAEISRLVEDSGFIFRGRVTRQETAAGDATTQAAVSAEVDEILLSTDVLRGLRGRTVTIVGEHTASVGDEGTFVFFTNCIVLSDHAVLRGLAYVRASSEVERDVAEAISETGQRPLRERIASAQLIIEGHVNTSRAADPDAIQTSEHDPNWWIANVAVDDVIKSPRRASRTVAVLFANSRDIVWVKSPKLHEGVRGIMLLHTVDESDRPPRGARVAYQATHPLDLQPSERLPEIRRALSASSSEDRGSR